MLHQPRRKISIILADDHALVLEDLRGLLAREPDMEVVATATSGEALLYTQPDVVVLDVQLPDRDGFSCLAEIRRRNLPVKVVILSVFGGGGALQATWGTRPTALCSRPTRRARRSRPSAMSPTARSSSRARCARPLSPSRAARCWRA